MNRGTKIALLMIGGAVVIGLIAYFVFVPFFTTGQPTKNDNANTPTANIGNPAENINSQESNFNMPPPPAEVSDEAKQAAAARSIAQTFAVRLSTYTNQNALDNLADLRTISTSAVWSYLNGEYKNGLIKSLPAAKDYYAVTGTAVNVSMTRGSDGEMAAIIPMQKVETGTVSKTSYATLDLKLRLVEGAWLVSWLEWKK